MDINKADRRDKKSRKKKNKDMVVDNKSIFTIEKVIQDKSKKKEK
jgi:hypothetical protein